MYPLSETLEAFAPFLPEPLVAAPALERARGTASHLPAPLTDRLCLECRLGDDDPSTDLVIGVEGPGRAILASSNAAVRLHPALLERHPWRRVAAFSREWQDPGSPLHEAVERLWLEFDLPASGPPDLPLPGVFLDLSAAACATGSARERCATVAAALRSLLGRAPPGSTRAGLLRCLEALPPGATIPYVGVLIPRGTEVVRLCVVGLGEDRLPGYLRAAGVAFSPAALEPLLERVRGCEERGGAPRMSLLHLDVGGSPLPRLGLEFTFARPDQLRGRLREAAFLDLLVELGWCTPAKRDALLAWPGCAVASLPHELWPSLALRHLAHVKVVLEGERVREAKAYLSLRHTPRRRAR